MKKFTKVKSSRIEDGVEICNTCCNHVDNPFRYENSNGDTRGCVASCHDTYVARNTRPGWVKPRMVLPAWITAARRLMPMFEKISARSQSFRDNPN